MKRLVTLMAVGTTALLSAGTSRADIKGTNTWVGATSGGSWATASNWKSVASDGTDNADATSTFNVDSDYVYDFSALKDGAVVTSDSTSPIRVAGLTFAANQGTVTLQPATGRSQDDFYFSKSQASVSVGKGTTVKFGLRHEDAWNYDAGTTVQFAGGGAFKYDVAGLGLRATFRLTDGLTLVLPQKMPEYWRSFRTVALEFLDSASELDIQADGIMFSSITSADGAEPKVLLNGHDLVFDYAIGTGLDARTFGGTFEGPGRVLFQGGFVTRLTNADPFRSGARLVVQNAELSASADALPSVAVEENGVLQLTGESPAIGTLVGGSAEGRIAWNKGAHLTVGGTGSAAASTYSARLAGDGALVKDGAGYSLTLDGVNAYTGGTEVKAGTLTVKASPLVADGLVAHYTFDDPDNLGKDALGRADLAGTGVSAVAGVMGGAAHFFQQGEGESSASKLTLTNKNLAQAGLPVGNEAVSFAFWTRIANRLTEGMTVFSLYGNWVRGAMHLLWCASNGAAVTHACGNGYGETTSGSSNLRDGLWHHVACTYDGAGTKTLYVDGQLKATAKDQEKLSLAVDATASFCIGYDGKYRYGGDLDDYRIYRRVLTAADVKSLYEMKAPATGVNPAADLPNPVAQYTFDDPDRPFVDSSGNNYDLAAGEADKSPAHVAARTGAFGGCVKLDGTSYLKAGAFPSKIPTDSSFSVSLRFQPGGDAGGASYVFWGAETASTDGQFFRVSEHSGQIMSPDAGFSSTDVFQDGDVIVTRGGYDSPDGNAATWRHMVYVYEASTKCLVAYRDGHLAGTLIVSTAYAATQGLFALGYDPAKAIRAKCYLDDVRVFDQALTAAQVRALAQSLETGSVGSVLPAEGTVTVAEDATLRAVGVGTVVPSLAGAGRVEVEGGSSLTLKDAKGFTGTVGGCGSLYLAGAFGGSFAEDFAGRLGLSDTLVTDAVGTGLPVASYQDKVLAIPAKGTLTLNYDDVAQLKFRRLVLAEAKELDAPADFSGWKVEPENGEKYRPTFFVEAGKDGVQRFVVRMHYKRGIALIIR